MKLRLLPAAVLIVGCVDSLADLHVASGSSALSVSVARSSDLGGPIEPGIVGGTEHTGNPEVAFILAFDAQDNPLFSCTGTLIAPKLVLTAAHCVDDDPEPAAAYAVYFGTDVTVQEDPGELFLTSAESAVFHPGWDPNDLENGNDIGLIHLLDEVPIQPARLRTAPLTDADLGDPVHLVGWGITGGGRDDSGVKRHAFSRLDDFTDNLVVVGNSQTNTCNGDSGGPAFLERGGVEEIIGITSFGDTDCEIEGVSTRVDAFLDFIAANGGPGGGGPGGPGPGGFGAPCDEGAACESGLCLLQNGVGFC
ncbi:MAG TPA: trypsin-like serine protease, partial [Candidatus Acidoferrum sp.]|nr:trypsin-like serine protease [Candidatus Acidoferrum sp.]